MSESLCKGSYLPHIRLVLAYLIEIPSMPLQEKIGACGCLVAGILENEKAAPASTLLQIVTTAAGTLPQGHPVISGGLIRLPLFMPREIGVMSVQDQICPRKIPGTVRAVLCFGNGYSGERLIRE